MSEFFRFQRLFDQLNKEQKNKEKKTFSHELFSRSLSYQNLETVKNEPKASLASSEKPVESKNIEVGPKTPQEVENEKVDLLKNFNKFVESKVQKTGKPLRFQGGEVEVVEKEQDDYLVLSEELSLGNDIFIDPIADRLDILFLGEKPKDFSHSEPHSSLLFRMIQAMELKPGFFSRVFLEQQDPKMWPECLGLTWENFPRAVVTLGAFATSHVLGKKEKLSRIHGKKHLLRVELKGIVKELAVFPLFHPDILTINPNMKRSAWIDLQEIMKFLDEQE